MEMLYRTWAQIDLAALAHNFNVIRQHCSQKIYAVIKADAYGHGAVEVARTLEKAGTDGFAVSNIAEAQELRRSGIGLPILILGYTPAECAGALAEGDIAQCVYSLEYAQSLEAAAQKLGKKLQVNLKLDTGMGRIGFDCRSENTPGLEEAKQVLKMENLDCQGVFMHFATADMPQQQAFVQQQYERFSSAVAQLEQTGHRFALRHCCNSAAIETLETEKFDAVRAGIILYGLAPSDALQGKLPLKSVMSLYSVVSMVKTVETGESVSYGRTWLADKPRKIATVTAGYADGVPRLLSGRGWVLIHGKKAPIVGRVCMDQFCVDVTDIPEAKLGDRVTVFGPGLPVDQVARWAETISYEIVCGVSKRVPRKYTE